jgi:hypothetical protein
MVLDYLWQADDAIANVGIEEIAYLGDFDTAILGIFKASAYIFYTRLLVAMSFNQNLH